MVLIQQLFILQALLVQHLRSLFGDLHQLQLELFQHFQYQQLTYLIIQLVQKMFL